MFRELGRALGRFRHDKSGGMAVMIAGAVPVLTVIVGAAVDYARIEDVRTRLQHAADASVLAVTQAQVLGLEDAEERADPLFDANFTGDGVRIVERDVEQRGFGYAAITVDAEVDTFFLELIGFDTIDVQVYAEAQFSLGQDIEITVFFDNSASMLIGASRDDIADFERAFGCAFACHFRGRNTYERAQDLGAETRLEVARDALLRSFAIADESASAGVSTTHFDIRTFSYEAEMVVRATATEMLGAAGDPVRGIEPAPPDYSGNVYAATDYEAIFDMADDVIAKTVAFPESSHFLLLITDGVADYYRVSGRRGRRYIEPFDPALCDAIKEAGVRIGVIYTTYFEIPRNNFWRRNVRPFNDDIGPNLAACATPGWFFEAEFAEDIDAAFRQLMELAMPKPQLTQ